MQDQVSCVVTATKEYSHTDSHECKAAPRPFNMRMVTSSGLLLQLLVTTHRAHVHVRPWLRRITHHTLTFDTCNYKASHHGDGEGEGDGDGDGNVDGESGNGDGDGWSDDGHGTRPPPATVSTTMNVCICDAPPRNSLP